MVTRKHRTKCHFSSVHSVLQRNESQMHLLLPFKDPQQSVRAYVWFENQKTLHINQFGLFFFWSLPIKRSSGVWVCLCCGVAAVQLVVSTEMERSSASAADTQISTAPTDLWSDVNSPHSLAEPCLVPAHWYHRHIPWCICWQLDQAHCNSFIMTLWP